MKNIIIDNIEYELVPVKEKWVTEDGVDVFEGDNVAWVINGRFAYMCTLHKNHIKGCLAEYETYKIFSTKEIALEYIKLNEVKYSLNDLVKVANHYAYVKNIDAERILKNVDL